MLVHFTDNHYDHSLDWPGLCKKLFGDNQCLCMMEVKGHDHLHVQGELAIDERDYARELKVFSLGHYRKKQDPKSHPIKRAGNCDEKGFQYMSKELPSSVVVYKQGFSDEELHKLYELSQIHREELQAGLTDFIRDAVTEYVRLSDGPPSPKSIHVACAEAGYEYYASVNKMDPPNIRGLIRFAMRKHFNSSAVKTYLAALNL